MAKVPLKTIEKKVKRIEQALDRYERFAPSVYSLEYIENQICWLWKFRYISKEKMEELADRVIAINKNNLRR